MNIYDQLLGLQVIENAFREWEDYREELTDYIISNTKDNKSIGILGAGRCNDINLKKIADYYDQVTLIDKDREAMLQGIRQYELENASNINIKVCDFAGISGDDYRHYGDALVQKVRERGMQTNCHELACFARQQLDAIYKKATNCLLDFGTYENTVVVGVHSQLISMLEWIWSIILQTIGQQEESVRHQINQMNQVFVERFNQGIFEATQATAIVGCELQRVGRIGAIQGAIQGLEDIKRREMKSEIELFQTTKLNWPFHKTENIEYVVQVQTLCKKTHS